MDQTIPFGELVYLGLLEFHRPQYVFKLADGGPGHRPLGGVPTGRLLTVLTAGGYFHDGHPFGLIPLW